VNEWLKASGKRVKPVMELGSVEALKKLCEAGLGVAIIPAMAMQDDATSSPLVVRPLFPKLERTLALALRRDKHMTAPLRALSSAINRPSKA
jgi:DNA-binding transcriptional LysR family regulator